MNDLIFITPSAINHLIKLKPSGSCFLRIKVQGGGCSGLSYNMNFEQGEHSDDDMLILENGIYVLVDKKSSLFIKGMMLDFSDGLNGKGFEFSNPNAKRVCGCGSSFSI